MLEEFFKQTTEHWLASTLIAIWIMAVCCIKITFHVNEEEDKRR